MKPTTTTIATLCILAMTPLARPQNCTGEPVPPSPFEDDACCNDHVIDSQPAGACYLTCADAIDAIPNWRDLYRAKCAEVGEPTQDVDITHAVCTLDVIGDDCIRDAVCHFIDQYICEDFSCSAPYTHIKGCGWIFTGYVERWVVECDENSDMC